MTAATQSPVSECLTSDSFLFEGHSSSRYHGLVLGYFQLSIACRIIEPGGCSFSSVLIPAGSVIFARIEPLFALGFGAVGLPPFCVRRATVALISSAPMPMCVIVGFASGIAGAISMKVSRLI